MDLQYRNVVIQKCTVGSFMHSILFQISRILQDTGFFIFLSCKPKQLLLFVVLNKRNSNYGQNELYCQLVQQSLSSACPYTYTATRVFRNLHFRWPKLNMTMWREGQIMQKNICFLEFSCSHHYKLGKIIKIWGLIL